MLNMQARGRGLRIGISRHVAMLAGVEVYKSTPWRAREDQRGKGVRHRLSPIDALWACQGKPSSGCATDLHDMAPLGVSYVPVPAGRVA